MTPLPDDVEPHAAAIKTVCDQAGLTDVALAPASETADLHSLNNEIRLLTDRATGARYVLRLPNTRTAAALGIVRPHEHVTWAAAAEAGVAPPLLGASDGVMLSPYLPERARLTSADLGTATAVERLGAMLRTLQSIRVPHDVPTTYDRLRTMVRGCADAGSPLPDTARWLARVDELEAAHAGDRYPRGLVHHDIWANNLLDDGTRWWLLDFEFAGAGDGWHDLASVAQDAGLDDDGRRHLLRAAGRAGDDADLAAVLDGEWMIGLFEACWATTMAAHGTVMAHQGGTFDYLAHADAMLARLG